MNPAGGEISSVADQLRYARFHLGNGTVDGAQILSASSWPRTPYRYFVDRDFKKGRRDGAHSRDCVHPAAIALVAMRRGARIGGNGDRSLAVAWRFYLNEIMAAHRAPSVGAMCIAPDAPLAHNRWQVRMRKSLAVLTSRARDARVFDSAQIMEVAMDRVTLNSYVCRAAGLLDRRALFGGLSSALLAAGAVPFTVEARKPGQHKRKQCKKQAQSCRSIVPDFCEGDPECIEDLNKCCGLLAKCKSEDKAQACCRNVGVCDSATPFFG